MKLAKIHGACDRCGAVKNPLVSLWPMNNTADWTLFICRECLQEALDLFPREMCEMKVSA